MQIFVKTLIREAILFLGIFLLCLTIRDLHHSVMVCRSLWRPSQEGLFSFWDSLYSFWLQYLQLASLSDGMQIFVKTLMRRTIPILGIIVLGSLSDGMQIFVKSLTRKTIPISEFIVHCLNTISVTCITQWRYADFCEDPYGKDYSLFGNLSTLPDYNICDLHHSMMICRSWWRPSWEGPFSFWNSLYCVWL